jgi:hypothetical protein
MGKLLLGNKEITPILLSTGIPRQIVSGSYTFPNHDFSFELPHNITSLGNYACAYAFRGCTTLKSVDFSSVQVAGAAALYYTFYGCTGLTGSIDFSSLTTTNGSSLADAFYNCANITGVDFSSLSVVNGTTSLGSTFRGCTKLESVSFPSLTRIGADSSTTNYGHFSYCFYGCTKITELRFPELTAIYSTGGSTTSYGTFSYNNYIQKLYFPKLATINYGSGASTANQASIKNLFNSCSALTEIHFAEENQTAIEASPGYSTAWGRGASNVTIYFDL